MEKEQREKERKRSEGRKEREVRGLRTNFESFRQAKIEQRGPYARAAKRRRVGCECQEYGMERRRGEGREKASKGKGRERNREEREKQNREEGNGMTERKEDMERGDIKKRRRRKGKEKK